MDPTGRMPMFGPGHLTVLAITVLAIVILLPMIRRAPTVMAERTLAIAGWALLAVTLFWTVWGLLPGNFNVNESLPLHYSDALRIVASLALITRARWAVAVSFFWGLTFNLQSVITPDLNYFHYPVLEFVMYWFLHSAVLIAPILLVWGLGYRPTWRGVGVTCAITALWGLLALTANVLLGSNYGYLSHQPRGASVLDLLGGWPTYIFWEAVLLTLVWCAMAWPFNGGRRGMQPGVHRGVQSRDLNTRTSAYRR